MATGLTDLINNIQGSIDGLISDFTGNGDSSAIPGYYKGFSEFRGVQSQVNVANWNTLTFPYTFSVININNPQDHAGFGDFALPLAPSAINQREEPAINIKPTQGGTTVNHNGNRYKTLTISGTTGVAPFRGEGGVNRKTGEAIFQPKELKYKSGYEVFLHLRNWFRTYYEYKHKLNLAAQNYRLVFKNYKDGEFLIVELLSFEMDRQAARSFLYDYKIEFKVISHFQFKSPKSELLAIEDTIQSALDLINQAKGTMLRAQGILRQVESVYNSTVLEPLRQATLAIKALQGIGIVAGDVSRHIIADTVSSVVAFGIVTGIKKLQDANAITGALDPRIAAIKLPVDVKSAISAKGSTFIADMGEGLMALDSAIFPPATLAAQDAEAQNALNNPRQFYTDAISNIQRVKDNAEDLFNLGSPELDALFNRTSTIIPGTGTVTNTQYDLLNAFNQAIEGLYLLISVQDLFKATFEDRIADMNSRFAGNITLQSSLAAQQIKLPDDVTLERLAQQYLGDSQRWGEIAELNNLVYPFIWNGDRSVQPEGSVKPGDNLLIPTTVRNGFSQLPQGATNKLTANMSEMEKSLGCDLKVDGNFDLVLTNSGDFEIVAGAENMGQAVLLKLSYEPGEVVRYPELGAGVVPGRKFPALEDIKDGVTQTLLQDSRIDAVQDLSLLRDGSALTLSFNLKIKQIDIPIPVKIKI